MKDADRYRYSAHHAISVAIEMVKGAFARHGYWPGAARERSKLITVHIDERGRRRYRLRTPGELPSGLDRIYRMRTVEGLSFERIGRLLYITPKTAHRQFTRACALLDGKAVRW